MPDNSSPPLADPSVDGGHVSGSSVLGASPVGTAVLRGPALEYELANPAWLELVGAVEDPVGRRLGDADPALAALLATPAAEVARSGAPLDARDVALPRRRAGERAGRWATFRLRALPDEPGRGCAVLVVADETTARVLAQVRAEALAAIGADPGESRTLADLLEHAAARTRELLVADSAFVLLADADSPRLRGKVDLGSGSSVEVAVDAADLPAGAAAMSRGEPVIFRSEPTGRLEAAWLGGRARASGLCAPIPGDARPLGLLYLTWAAGAPMAEADVAFAAAVASACSLAIRRSRTLRREREARLASHRATERLELLAESGALLTGAVDWLSVVRTTAQLGLGYLADVALLDLVAPDGVLRREAVEPASDPHVASLPVPKHHPVQSPALHDALLARRTRRVVMPAPGAAGESGDVDLAVLARMGATSCIAAPLVIRGRGAGVLTLVRRAPSPPHEPEDVALATEIARRAAIALDDARLLAAAAEEAAARDAFLAAAGHDVRSPVTALRLQAQALERSGGLGDRGRLLVSRLRKSVDRLARRVEQVLDAARADPRGSPLRREPLDLAELAAEVLARLAHERGGTAVPVRLIAPDPVRGIWDRSRVDAILSNLVAVAMKRGGEEVRVRVGPEAQGARIEVYRAGAKDEAAAPHGQQAAAHEEMEVGVWIARRFAEAQGGRLRVERLPSVGARFMVDLPG